MTENVFERRRVPIAHIANPFINILHISLCKHVIVTLKRIVLTKN